MAKYILGFKDGIDELVQFPDKTTADYESEEWVEIEADSLKEAKEMYEEAFNNWKQSQMIKKIKK